MKEITITLIEQVHIDVRLDGKTIEQDLTAGDHSVPLAIAELLIAQGFATVTTAGGKKKTTEPVVDPEPIQES